MAWFTIKNGEVFAYDDDQQYLAIDRVENFGHSWITSSEADDLRTPPPPPPYVPQQVTRAQGKAALIMAGLWDDVLAYVDGIEDPTEKALALVALNDTTHWQRSSPFLNAAATALGLTQEQLGDLFMQATEVEL